MESYYSESWFLYKAHTQSFTDDYDYYYEFCKGYDTLELFAGYGRLTNFLIDKKINIESIEIESNFSSFIHLPEEKNHTCDILKFFPNKKYERIIAAYNSFCLFTTEDKVELFFKKIDSFLARGGIASLSYYPVSAWKKNKEEIIIDGRKYLYQSDFNLDLLHKNIAIWIDQYFNQKVNLKFEYPTRIYKNEYDIYQFLQNTNLELIDIVENYKNENIQDKGWIEYVLQAK